MKFLSILTSAFLGLTFASPCAAIVENQVRILLNNGEATTDMSCSGADMLLVMKSLLFTRRNLRQGKNKVDEQKSLNVEESYDSGRKLPVVFYPATCKTSCQGFATGTCVAPACKGFRREMKGLENDRDLELQSSSSSSGGSTSGSSGGKSVGFAMGSGSTNSNGTSTSSGISMSTNTTTNVDSATWCSTAVGNVNTFLDLLISGGVVSGSCAKLLQAPRNVTCLSVSC